MKPLLSKKDIKRAEEAMNAIIETTAKEHRLLYQSIQSDCPNCIFDPISNRSSGRYKTGGTRPFPNGTICPVCRGVGKLASESFETIWTTVEWNPKNFYAPTTTIQVPNSICQTVGYIADLPKVLKSKKIVLEIALEGYIKYVFNLNGEPIDPFSITPGKFFVATWKREGTP